VPLDVAVEEPDTGVVGAETDDGVAVVLDHDRVTSNGSLGNLIRQALVVTGSDVRALKDLELVAVQVPRVQIVVVVVDNDFDNIVVLHHEWVNLAVDLGVGGELGANGVGGVKCWDLRRHVGLVVYSETLDPVDFTAASIQNDLVVHWRKDGFAVFGNEVKIVDELEVSAEDRGRWQGLGFIVDQPGSSIGVVSRRNWPVLKDEHHVHIHGIPDGEVFASVWLSVNQDTHALSITNTQELVSNRVGLNIDTVDFNHGHLVAVEHPGVTGPVS
jgi:hypothetical protein